MKILHITASYKPAYVYGGPIMSVAKLCEELVKQHSKEITVYTTLANGKEELPYKSGTVKNFDGVEVHYFKRITKDHSHLSPALLWHLWKTIKQFDVVHIHAWWNLVTMPACFIAILRRKKIILTPRGTLSNYSFQRNNSSLKNIFHRLIGKKLLNNCYFHLTSKKEAEDTKQLLKPKAIFKLPNFVNLPWHKQIEKNITINSKRTLKLIFLSRIEHKKGLDLLFEVLADVKFNWNLSIVGNGEAEYIETLKSKVKSLNLDNNITWFEPIYGDSKFELIAQNDYLILPSFDENFANVVIESIYTGTPVLITENVGLSDYVSDKNLGLVAKRNHQAIKEMLEQSIDAKETEKFTPQTLNNTIRVDFAEAELVNKYLNMYQKIL